MFQEHIKGTVFYLLFAITVTASVQLIGVYLVFASPALTVLRMQRFRLLVGYGLGIAGYATGLFTSAIFDLPTGAIIVCRIAILALIFPCLSMRKKH